jgi:hypothetical protein
MAAEQSSVRTSYHLVSTFLARSRSTNFDRGARLVTHSHESAMGQVRRRLGCFGFITYLRSAVPKWRGSCQRSASRTARLWDLTCPTPEMYFRNFFEGGIGVRRMVPRGWWPSSTERSTLDRDPDRRSVRAHSHSYRGLRAGFLASAILIGNGRFGR